MESRKSDLSSMVDKTKSVSEQGVWYAGLIITVHACIEANSEIIYIPKRKGATIF